MAPVQELQELPVRNYLYSCTGTTYKGTTVRQAGPVAGLSGGCLGSRCCNWLLGLRQLGWRLEGLSLKLKLPSPHLKSGRKETWHEQKTE